MATVTSVVNFTAKAIGSSFVELVSNNWTDDAVHAYRQEFQLTSAENEVIWDTNDDPGYGDFVMLRVQVLDWGASSMELPIRITSGADSMEFVISKSMPVFELHSMDAWTDNSDTGTPDTIDEILLMGQGTSLFAGLSSPVVVRVTAYCVAS